jgi:hypothetical protein
MQPVHVVADRTRFEVSRLCGGLDKLSWNQTRLNEFVIANSKIFGGIPMAKDEHNKAAEHHENAAKSHRAAAEQHGKGDHAKGKEHSATAQQHAQSAGKQSEQAHSKSQQQK